MKPLSQQQYAQKIIRSQSYELACTESPSEEAMLNALIRNGEACGYKPRIIKDLDNELGAGEPPDGHLFIFPQFQIDRYRVDFFIALAANGVHPSVVVECDGYKFHKVSKKQSSADAMRDRFLQMNGHTVLRYTGTEIARYADLSAKEIIGFLKCKTGITQRTQ